MKENKFDTIEELERSEEYQNNEFFSKEITTQNGAKVFDIPFAKTEDFDIPHTYNKLLEACNELLIRALRNNASKFEKLEQNEAYKDSCNLISMLYGNPRFEHAMSDCFTQHYRAADLIVHSIARNASVMALWLKEFFSGDGLVELNKMTKCGVIPKTEIAFIRFDREKCVFTYRLCHTFYYVGSRSDCPVMLDVSIALKNRKNKFDRIEQIEGDELIYVRTQNTAYNSITGTNIKAYPFYVKFATNFKERLINLVANLTGVTKGCEFCYKYDVLGNEDTMVGCNPLAKPNKPISEIDREEILKGLEYNVYKTHGDGIFAESYKITPEVGNFLLSYKFDEPSLADTQIRLTLAREDKISDWYCIKNLMKECEDMTKEIAKNIRKIGNMAENDFGYTGNEVRFKVEDESYENPTQHVVPRENMFENEETPVKKRVRVRKTKSKNNEN